MENKFVITIGRQLGSGGKRVGELLAARFGVTCYDKELILMASQKSGLGEEFFEKADEKSRYSFFGNLFGFRSGISDDNTPANYLSNETLFQIQSEVIRSLAEQDSCIFVGRCADYILRDHPRCISFFISADFKDRIARLKEGTELNESDVARQIEAEDKKRSGYYNYYTDKTWGMATSYDFCINSSRLGLERTVDLIEDYIRRFLIAD